MQEGELAESHRYYAFLDVCNGRGCADFDGVRTVSSIYGRRTLAGAMRRNGKELLSVNTRPQSSGRAACNRFMAHVIRVPTLAGVAVGAEQERIAGVDTA